MIVAYRSFLSAMCFNRGKTPLPACRRFSPSLLFLSSLPLSTLGRRATLNFGSFAYQIRRRINTRSLPRRTGLKAAGNYRRHGFPPERRRERSYFPRCAPGYVTLFLRIPALGERPRGDRSIDRRIHRAVTRWRARIRRGTISFGKVAKRIATSESTREREREREREGSTAVSFARSLPKDTRERAADPTHHPSGDI